MIRFVSSVLAFLLLLFTRGSAVDGARGRGYVSTGHRRDRPKFGRLTHARSCHDKVHGGGNTAGGSGSSRRGDSVRGVDVDRGGDTAMVVTDVTESAESLLKPPGVRSAISSSRMDRYRTDSRKSIVVLDVIQVKIVHLARTKVLDDERMRRVLQVRRPEDWRDQRSIIRVPDLELSELFSTYERPQL